MEMAAASSLAEVGVGLNLAFGLLESVRQKLTSLLRLHLTAHKSEITTILSDFCTANGTEGNSVKIIHFDDAYSLANRILSLVEKVFIAFAFLAVFSLIYFLYEASITPSNIVDDLWAFFVLYLVIMPILGNYFFQGLIYVVAVGYFLWNKKKYKDASKLLGSAISVKEPSD